MRWTYSLTDEDRAEVTPCVGLYMAQRRAGIIRDAYGLNISPQGAELINRIGTEGELALARLMGLRWRCSTGPGNPDVGRYGVRTVTRLQHRLIIHPKDLHPPVLMLRTGGATYRVRGWLPYAELAKRPDWWETGTGRPAYFVPNAALHPPDSIPELAPLLLGL